MYNQAEVKYWNTDLQKYLQIKSFSNSDFHFSDTKGEISCTSTLPKNKTNWRKKCKINIFTWYIIFVKFSELKAKLQH